jgi:hypothetical protein
LSEENGDAYLSPLIPDGWTFKATIPALAGRWSALTFRYRPMSPDEESEVWAQIRAFPGEPTTKFYAPLMAKKIVGWDMKDHVGEKVAITEDVLRHRIPPPLYDALKQYTDGTLAGELEKN